MQDPVNDEEWQEAVNGANFLLLVESARMYGLITGGPSANIERCEEILRRGKARGIVPQETEIK